MADENFETFEDQNNQIDYDSEEEFIDDTQFEDPKGFVDAITEDGRNIQFHFQKNVKNGLHFNKFFIGKKWGGVI